MIALLAEAAIAPPPHDLLGKAFALANAVVWAIALIFFKRSGDHVHPVSLNFFKNIVGIVLLALTIAAVQAASLAWAAVESPGVPLHLLDPTRRELWILIVSGVLGIAIADTVFFYGLNLAGVGIIAIVDCLYTPFVILFSVLMLHEPIGYWHLLGAALILGGVGVSTGHSPPPDRTRGQILAGIALAVAAMAMMAYGIVLAKPVLSGNSPLWTSTIRLVGGTVVLAAIGGFWPGRESLAAALRPSRTWRVTLPGAFFGGYLGMVMWIAGFAYTHAAAAAMLNQTSTIFALVLATVFLGEKLTVQKVAAVALAMAGVVVVVSQVR